MFEADEEVNLKFNTVREIVGKLERYNLSDTSEDVKGIAFERFLGRTFRGEIGQFFTPRTIVEFMIRMVDPKESDIICDPASGSGGFLIRFFEIVREQILADVDRQYQEYKTEIDKKSYSSKKKAELLREKYEQLQLQINPYASREGASREDAQKSRIWKLANTCIYGCDANDRMARTSKMNMIMHGDGHGGVHHHDGFINVNGIFEGRFNIVLTNPPFGANVEQSDHIEESHYTVPDEVYRRYKTEYPTLYQEAIAKIRAAKGKPILSLFKLPKKGGKIKTEILFMERCLELLKPGGTLGIVLPEGIFNNPSLAYVREFCEDRAFIRAVISLPQETFYSAGASVKASLLFMEKFTEKEAADFEKKRKAAVDEVAAKYKDEIIAEVGRLQAEIESATKDKDKARRKKAQTELTQYEKRMEELKASESRRLLKQRFTYPVFLYDAEHVGITATGEQDACELYYNEKLGLPAGLKPEDTALETYRRFTKRPNDFIIPGDNA